MSAWAVLLSLLAAGCTTDDGAASADCAAAIRRDGTVYIEAGSTRHPAVASGRAARAECHDVGRDAPGIVFPRDAESVTVVAFVGQDARQVLGVREGMSTRVFVAEGVVAEPVLEALQNDGDGS